MTTPLALAPLFSLLEEKDMWPTLDEENRQIYTALEVEGNQFLFFFSPREESEILQMTLYFPYSIQEGVEENLARLLHIFNKDIDLAGFGMDEMEKLVYYRLSLPCLHGHIPLELFDRYLEAKLVVAETFAQPISVGVTGDLNVNDILEEST